MLSEEITEIEQKMESSARFYFDTTINFVKWTTAFAVVSILWFGNNFKSLSSQLNPLQYIVAYLSLISFLIAIVTAVAILYGMTRYWNDSWRKNLRHRRSLISQPDSTPQGHQEMREIATELSDDQVLRLASGFEFATYLHMTFLICGLTLFLAFLTIK
jgi:hypothetical protein